MRGSAGRIKGAERHRPERSDGSNAIRPWSGRLTPPSVVLGRSWKSADARHHELRLSGAKLSAVSCSLSPDLLNTGLTPRPQERKGAAAPPSRKFVLGLATGVAVLGPWSGMENASGRLRRPSVVLMPDRTAHWTLTPLTLTLSPQAGRGNKCSRRAPCPPLAPWNGEPRPQAEIPAGSKGWGEGKWSCQF